MMADHGYKAGQVMKLTGLPYRTLDGWARTGFLPPSLVGPAGTGNDRLWSFTDLVALRAAVQLREAGVSPRGLKRVVAHLRARRGLESNSKALASVYLVTDGRRVFEVDAAGVIDALTGQGCVFMLPLGSVVADLRRDIAERRHHTADAA